MSDDKAQLTKINIQELNILAARLSVGTASADDIKLIVNNTMKQGIYYDEFIDILDCERLEDIEVSFAKLLDRFNISIPDKDSALLSLLVLHLKEIASESVDPLTSLNNLSLECGTDFWGIAQTYTDVAQEINYLYGYYFYSFDYDSNELKREMVKLSKQVLEKLSPTGIING